MDPPLIRCTHAHRRVADLVLHICQCTLDSIETPTSVVYREPKHEIHDYLLMDRDAKFGKDFRDILHAEGVKSVRLPSRSPNLNAHLERYFGSLKSECLDKMIFFDERSLRNAVRQFVTHCHGERNHQSLTNTIIDPSLEVGRTTGKIQCRERLGGMLRYYHRAA